MFSRSDEFPFTLSTVDRLLQETETDVSSASSLISSRFCALKLTEMTSSVKKSPAQQFHQDQYWELGLNRSRLGITDRLSNYNGSLDGSVECWTLHRNVTFTFYLLTPKPKQFIVVPRGQGASTTKVWRKPINGYWKYRGNTWYQMHKWTEARREAWKAYSRQLF